VRRAALALLALAACDDSTPGSLLDGPRVLALIAEPPVLAPDTSAELTAVTSLDGAPTAPDAIAWRVCSPYVPVVDPVRDCEGVNALALAVDGDGRVVIDARTVAAHFGITVPPNLPADTCASPLSLTVVAEIELAGSRLIAKKQIAVAAAAAWRNPTFVHARIDGVPVDATAELAGGSMVIVDADIAVDSLDIICDDDDGTEELEDVRVFVYPGGGAVASDESFEIEARDGVVSTGSVELELPAAGGNVPLWLVAVDDTGGAAAAYIAIMTR
jgi:hypothetical protein